MAASTAACHTRTFPLQVNQCRLDPALCGSLLALPLTKTTIGVWDSSDGSMSDALPLIGHKRTVGALCFSHDEPRLLCSAGEDYVIVWNVRKCLHAAAQGLEVRGEVVLAHPGDVSCVAFSLDAARVAVCAEVLVKVVSVSQSKVEAELTGHAAKVTAAQFCPHYWATLVTVSDDRTVMVWDVQHPSLLYQSSVLCSAPLISLAMNPSEPQVAVASANGVIKVLDLADDKNFRQLCQLDVGKMLSKFRQAQLQRQHPSPGDGPLVVSKGGVCRKGEGQGQQGGEGGYVSIESGDAVLSLLYVGASSATRSSQPELQAKNKLGSFAQTHGAMGEVLSATSPVLVVVSAHCAVQVDSRTLEVLTVLDFQQAIPSTFHSSVPEVTLQGIGLAATAQVSSNHLVLVVGTLFESTTHSIQWQVAAGTAAGLERAGDDVPLSASEGREESVGDLSMVATRPLTHNSPLKSEMAPQTAPGNKAATKKGRGSVEGRGKKADPMNQPLTFKSQVKSSGYTAAPRTTMFQPKTNARSKLVDTSKSHPRQGQSLVARLHSQEYPQDAGPPTELDRKLTTGAVPASVTDLSFSSSGQHLACSLSNKTSLVFPAPFGQKDSSVFVGHDSSINSVSWSHSGKHFLTASNDKTAILWDRSSGESLLVFNSLHNNVKSQGGGEKCAAKRDSYSKEVKAAQFYYMDKFVLVIVGHQLCLYKYHLDPTKDDIRRYLTKSKYKLVQSWDSPSQTLTALSAVNTFYSHLAACAGSNRNVEIYDLNEGRLSHVFSDTHAKPVHTVALNEGSTYTSQPQDAFNVFATSATLDGIKLWDVRSKRCVLRLQGHSNQAHGCGIAFSACGTYLGSGSEDKLAYVFDIRQGTFCQKLRGHTEVVTSVAFHPARPLMATGSTDGKVLVFKA